MHNESWVLGKLLTAEEARAAIALQGVSVSDWAKDRNFDPATVHRVLNGKISGAFGVGHRVKVALSMKPVVTTQEEAFAYVTGTADQS